MATAYSTQRPVRGFYSALAKSVSRVLGARPLTYRFYVSSTLDLRLGKMVEVYADVTNVTGFRRSVTVEEVGASAGKIQTDDVVFRIPWHELKDGMPQAKAKGISPADQIVDEDGVVFRVLNKREAAGGAAFEITATVRSVAGAQG